MAIRYTIKLALLLVLLVPQASAQKLAGDVDEVLRAIEKRQQRALPHAVQRLQRYHAGVEAVAGRGEVSRIERRTEYEPEGPDWAPDREVRYSYDAGDLATETHYSWAEAAWIAEFRILYSHTNGNLTALEGQTSPDGGANWLPVWRESYSYEQGRLSMILIENWTGEWESVDRTVLFYENGALVRFENEYWDGAAWQPEERGFLEQVGPDLVIVIEEYWAGAWMKEARITYRDITVDQLLSDSMQPEQTNSFFLFYLRLPSTVFEYWAGDDWMYEERTTWELDGKGRKAYFVTEYYEEEEWVMDSRMVYRYDDEGLLAAAEWQFMEEWKSTSSRGEGEPWVTFLREDYQYTDELLIVLVGSLVMDEMAFPLWRYTFSWIEAPVSVAGDGRARALALEAPYPNPAAGPVVFSYSARQSGRLTVAIYDIRGREVGIVADGLHVAGPHEVVFDTSGLASGLYIVRVSGEQGSVAQRISIVR